MPTQRRDDVEHRMGHREPRVQGVHEAGGHVRRCRDEIPSATPVLERRQVGDEQIPHARSYVHEAQVEGAHLVREGQSRLVGIVAIYPVVYFREVAVDRSPVVGVQCAAQTLDVLEVRRRERGLLVPREPIEPRKQLLSRFEYENVVRRKVVQLRGYIE